MSRLHNELLCCNSFEQLRRDRQIRYRSVRSDIAGVHTGLLYERNKVGDFECIRNNAATLQRIAEKAGEKPRNDSDDGCKMCCWQRVECIAFVGQCTNRCIHSLLTTCQNTNCRKCEQNFVVNTNLDTNILSSHRLELSERRSRRIWRKRRRQCGCRMLWIVRGRQQLYRRICAASMSAGRGVLPRPSCASIDRRSWQGLDLSASILACQKHSRFRRERARYSWRLEYHAAVAPGVFRRRDDLSNRLTSRLDCRAGKNRFESIRIDSLWRIKWVGFDSVQSRNLLNCPSLCL